MLMPPLVEHLHRRLEADALAAADQVFRRDAAVLEDHVAGVRALLPHLLVDVAQRQARGAALDDEGGDAVGTGRVGRGARHHREDAGLRGVGDVPLGAVQDVVAAILDRGGPQAGRVGPAVRLGQGEGADDLPGRQPGQVVLLLLLGAVDDDALRADAVVRGEEGPEGRRRPADLVRREDLLLHGEPHAAVLFRDRHSEQAEFLHLLDQVGGDLVGLGDLGTRREPNVPGRSGKSN